MQYRIRFHPDAELEFLDSYHWYEDHSIGLGDKFRTIVEEYLLLIQENPLLYPEKRNQFRECQTKTFPFLIVYKTILIVRNY
ncbi:MAG: plasmid stabilization system [Bacteroidetes bacterium HGW-Bacteroidetes-2]|jgi:hypothetical protein|nr:MAG: plasmid stabilization system [Bacteroidetes bacterium HGW-Bacteroidetes-8]PKP26771.1 MAG: plasmid stabilization system [Bacteroidetes bacterium HGW-Bacteroidetes-2]